MEKILVSQCLLGMPVRYDGGAHGPFDLLRRWQSEGRIVSVCPELAGGLPTPRPPAEVAGGQGAEVLARRVSVRTVDGEDVTRQFLQGAHAAVKLVRQHGIRYAVLKARSPSCGSLETYDGSFSGRRVPGEGVTAAALREVGVQVFDETRLAELEKLLSGS